MAVLDPTEHRVVVRRFVREAVTRGGIIIPDQYRDKLNEGEIIAVPRQGWLARLLAALGGRRGFCVGERILFGQYVGTDVRIGADEVFIIRDQDVFARIEGDDQP